MSVLATLRQDRAGEWTSVEDYVRELRHRDSAALAALAGLLAATAQDQREPPGHGVARAVHAAASAVGQARVAELLAEAPALHAGARAGLFALGLGELPEGHRTGWARLLDETCAAFRRAPQAARRVGLAPPWPPNLPE